MRCNSLTVCTIYYCVNRTPGARFLITALNQQLNFYALHKYCTARLGVASAHVGAF